MAAALSPSEIAGLRSDTPGVLSRVHLNSAGAALMPAPVVDAVVEHLQREAQIGGYEAHAEQSARIDRVHDAVAELIGAGRDEVALADSATLAWQRVFYSLPFSRATGSSQRVPSSPRTTSPTSKPRAGPGHGWR